MILNNTYYYIDIKLLFLLTCVDTFWHNFKIITKYVPTLICKNSLKTIFSTKRELIY